MLLKKITASGLSSYQKFLYLLLGSDRDECASNPCSRGSTCVDGLLKFTCICANGTTGDRCQCKLYLIMWSTNIQ